VFVGPTAPLVTKQLPSTTIARLDAIVALRYE